MKYYHYLLAFIILGAISCSKKDVEETTSNEPKSETPIVTNTDTKDESQTNSDSGANTETEAPAKEENNVSGEHSVVAKRLMDLMNDFIDNLTTAQDVESAKNAVAKFDEIAVNFEKIAKEMESLGLPDGQEAEAIKTLFSDTEKEIQTLIKFAERMGVKAFMCSHWANGGEGTKDLAAEVVKLCDENSEFGFLYKDDLPLFKKIETIAKEIYDASEVVADAKIREQLKNFEKEGYGNLPICVAKTQYSFSTDPTLKGAPSGHVLPIREIRLSSGAEFLVVVCGAIMTMPGLPKVPAADSIKLNDKGEIEGLF